MMNMVPGDPRNIVGYGDPNLHHADLDSTFEQLLEADNGLTIVKDILRAHRIEQNKIELHEFYRFAPIFRYNAVEELGEDRVVELTNEYFERICPFDPVSVVDGDGKTVYLLPPVFNRTEAINMAGHTATNIAQAFVNACQLPDEVSGIKRSKYLSLYQQLFDIAQDKNRYEHVKRLSDEMTSNLMHQINQEAQENMGIESIEQPQQKAQTPSNLNQKEIPSSSVSNVEKLPYGDDDEIAPL